MHPVKASPKQIIGPELFGDLPVFQDMMVLYSSCLFSFNNGNVLGFSLELVGFRDVVHH
jgi:hypothetical protein